MALIVTKILLVFNKISSLEDGKINSCDFPMNKVLYIEQY